MHRLIFYWTISMSRFSTHVQIFLCVFSAICITSYLFQYVLLADNFRETFFHKFITFPWLYLSVFVYNIKMTVFTSSILFPLHLPFLLLIPSRKIVSRDIKLLVCSIFLNKKLDYFLVIH